MWSGRWNTGTNPQRPLAGRLERVVQNRHPMRVSVRVVIVCVV
jgi:hypothetical protein